MAVNEPLPPGLRPEDELLLACARVSKEDAARRIGTVIGDASKTVDWEYVLDAAEEHGLMPLLYWHLGRGFEGSVPPEVLERLRASFNAGKLRSLALIGELATICRLFESAGVPAVPYKGPTLAASSYGDFALRGAGDLDILIPRRHFARCRDILLSMGYERTPWLTETRLSPAQEAAFLRFEREYGFTRYDAETAVELQWEVIPRYFSVALDVESLKTREVALGGARVKTLAPEELLLVLCVHGAKHFFERLIWITDISETARSAEMDWTRLLELAGDTGCRRILMLGLTLARDLVDADVPEKALREGREDGMVEVLAGEVRSRLFRKPDGSRGLFDESVFHSFHYNMRERRRDRIGYALRSATSPNSADWMDRPLPERLLALHYLLKPLRLASKYGAKVLKRDAGAR
jgi:hypothetical protein